jgi:hypothetical protein
VNQQTLIDLSRWQWALTAAFHITFPAITVATSIFMVLCYGMHMRSDDETWLRMFRFWRRMFGIGFAIGVVSGIVLTFEFGLNWGPFDHDVGPIIGVIIAMEVVSAFFLEAGFLGLVVYGDGRIGKRTMMFSTATTALDPQVLAQKITLVAQDAYVFDGTIRDNLDLADPGACDSAIWRALTAAALGETVAAFPLGLETPVGPAGACLSGGQRRRLSVAQGLSRHASVSLTRRTNRCSRRLDGGPSSGRRPTIRPQCDHCARVARSPTPSPGLGSYLYR